LPVADAIRGLAVVVGWDVRSMGRGPVGKLERREGVDLELKGERRAAGKSPVARRPYPPGEHGRRPPRGRSEYREQLRAKQRAKRYYGLREKQFRGAFARASRGAGVVGDQLLRVLELRLDNVLARLGLAATRAQARQFVSHGHVTVNGRRVDIPSFEVSSGDVVALRSGAPVEAEARRATELVSRVPPWLEVDHEQLRGHVIRPPEAREVQAPIDTQRIVELYSR
jgi:small subunit ribosomal protein S4